MEMGKSRLQATLDGSKEVGFTIVSMTLSLIAVFIPVLFMGGILGRLLREFGVVIIVAVLISGVVSLTLTPMLCSRMLVDERAKKHGRFYAWSERMFDALLGGYRRTLTLALAYRRLTLAVFFAVTVATGLLFSTMSKGFLPADDPKRRRPVITRARDVLGWQPRVDFEHLIEMMVEADLELAESERRSQGREGRLHQPRDHPGREHPEGAHEPARRQAADGRPDGTPDRWDQPPAPSAEQPGGQWGAVAAGSDRERDDLHHAARAAGLHITAAAVRVRSATRLVFQSPRRRPAKSSCA